jgi:anti-sigma factor RsiW
MTCAELVELVTEYLEGALDARERERFELHVVYCPGCEFHLEQMRETIRATGRLTEEELPEAARTALLEAFRDWKGSGER